MNWGLASFERKRIERIATEHPFFDMHAPLLNKMELRAALAQGPKKTGPQVIAEVREELGISQSPNLYEKRSFVEALRDASFVPSFRRTFVLCVLSLLILLFMTLTAPGRAFAEEVYSLFVKYIIGSLRVYTSSLPHSQHEYIFSSMPDDLSSPKALFDEIGYPIAITDDTLLYFHYSPLNDHSLVIRSKYLDNHGNTYMLQQGINNDNAFWGYGADMNGDPVQIQSDINMEMYGGVLEDGTNTLAGFSTYVMLQLSSKQLTIADLIQIAHKMYYVKK